MKLQGSGKDLKLIGMNLLRLFLVLGIFCGFTGCSQEPAPSRSTRANDPAGPQDVASIYTENSPTRPQPKLATLKLWIGTNEITAEIARRPIEIQTGMMWRTNMAEMDGMLFVFPNPSKVSFWMRNTLLPLSCAYIDSEGTILELHHMKPKDETSIPSASDRVRYVLEMNQGWFDRHGVKPGMLVTTESGPLGQIFFGR